ncbi:WEB family protein At1g12150-like [Apium graveolens]|uniref:WEB family protein At1g12150-like n=1 Tax=Apium graveolens TaxID=4045 RepID=UPI003D7B4062
MGEIDTKSIESVQASISLFGDKSDQLRSRPACYTQLEKENLEISLKLDQYEKTAVELFILLKNTEFEREIYMNACREAKMGIYELESKIKEMDAQLSETVKLKDENFQVLVELNTAKEELLNKDVELVEARSAKIEAVKEAEVMETALNMEMERAEELSGQVAELNETILHLQFVVLEAQKEKDLISSENQTALMQATRSAEKIREEMESTRNQLTILEGEVSEKSLLIQSLQSELQQANEVRYSAEKATHDAVNDIGQLISDMELLLTGNSKKDGQIIALEMELSQLRVELKIANKEGELLKCDLETMRSKNEKLTNEVNEIYEKESEAQIEIALLKSELHRGRSKAAAADAAEERAKREKLALELCIQQLALQAQEAKNKLQTIKDLAHKGDEERQNSEVIETDEAITDKQTNACISISEEDYKELLKKADQAEETSNENEALKREMESTAARIGELRTRAEQAVWRAEVAEKAKALLEEEKRKLKEKEERRKVAFEALRQESISLKNSFRKHPEPPKPYQPLGKILKMKF